MEIWDAYLPNGSLAGCDLVRGEPIPAGLCHLVSDILVRHTDGDYLLMQRDPRKRNYGGRFEATAGGSALKGEDAYCCARRELREETGILQGDLTHIGHFVSHNTIYESFLCVTDCRKDGITLQEGETVAYKWISEEEMIAFVNSGAMIDGQRQRYEPYLERMGYLKKREPTAQHMKGWERNMRVDVNELFEELGSLPQVQAIALGGSRATGRQDEKSDYDVYVYLTDAVDPAVRRGILEKYCGYMEIGNSFWELEDDVTLKDGIDMDIIYRDMDEFGKTVASVVLDCNPWNGYTTCMWHNLITSRIVLDKQGKLKSLQEKFSISYPQKLKINIIENNMKLLSGMLPSFDLQIKKAENRGDLVSVNHRVTEFLASYFDVIFALNEMTHPGEKRMQSICSKECRILPANFDANLSRLFDGMFRTDIAPVIADMVEELKKII